ncbi:MAG: hypothetical protein JSV64_05640 [Candidatus Bathyarchaeota archaeon]|nr:MAG: hypothetical protein JSV64_05640 [Candidatus Bathyarchaeota archaeon]
MLPIVICAVTVATVWLFPKSQSRIKSLFEEREFRIREAVFLVIAMGVMVTIIVSIPQQIFQTVQILFLAAYCFVLFLFTYIALEKWYFAILPSIVFTVLYISPLWNTLLINIFAIIFVVLISVYLGGLFSWKTVLAFTALLTIMDVIQVFATGFMGQSADRLVELNLPILIEVPTFPLNWWETSIRLGLGDLFLSGLLAIQTAEKFKDLKESGVISAFSIAFAFFIFEIIVVNIGYYDYFPATIVVVCGWLLGLGLIHLLRQRGT